LPQFPNPTEKDKEGHLIYATNEALVIAYTKACGANDACKAILNFMKHQEETITNYTNRNEITRDSY
jgi:hypothetical protein